MAKIPTYTRQVTPSGKGSDAYLSPSAANVGADYIGKGAEAIGQAVSGLGKTLAEIDAREKALTDHRSSMSYDTMAADASSRVQEELQLESDPDKRKALIERHHQSLSDEVAKLQFSPSKREEVNIDLNSWRVGEDINRRHAELKKTMDTTTAASKIALFDATRTGKVNIDKEIQEHQDVWELVNGPVTDKNKVVYETERDNLINQGTEKFWRKQSVDDPEKTMALLSAEGKQRKDGKGLIPEKYLTSEQLSTISKQAKATSLLYIKDMENDLHSSFVQADSKEMSPEELKTTADEFRDQVRGSKIPGKDKTRLLKAIRTWEKDEGSKDYTVINSLNQRIDQYIQSGVTDITLQDDIVRAKLSGAFGSRQGVVSRESSAMLKRLDAAEFKTNYNATLPVRAQFKQDVKYKLNSQELLFLYDKAVREKITANKDMNEAQSFNFAQVTAMQYSKLSQERAEELVGVRAEGKTLIPWVELPRAEQERDLLVLSGLDTSWWQSKGKEVKYGWTVDDVNKAEDIWEGKSEVTGAMIKEFGDYLTKKNKGHFKAGSRLPVITDDASGDAAFDKLRSGAIFKDAEGNIHRKN